MAFSLLVSSWTQADLLVCTSLSIPQVCRSPKRPDAGRAAGKTSTKITATAGTPKEPSGCGTPSPLQEHHFPSGLHLHLGRSSCVPHSLNTTTPRTTAVDRATKFPKTLLQPRDIRDKLQTETPRLAQEIARVRGKCKTIINRNQHIFTPSEPSSSTRKSPGYAQNTWKAWC